MQNIKSLIKSLLPERAVSHLQAFDHYMNGEEEIRLLPRLCTAGREAIDAGANIGTYSYFLRKYASRVHAYEPNPSLAHRLQRLFPDVNVRNVALSNAMGRVTLRVPLDSSGVARHELASIAQEFDKAVHEFSVDAVTIDSENFQDVGFIKVDVEQHEREVLRGALETIKRCRPAIMTEVSPLLYSSDLRDAFAFLTELDYVGWFKFGREYIRLSAFDSHTHANKQQFGNPEAFMGNNLLFFPAEHAMAQSGV